MSNENFADDQPVTNAATNRFDKERESQLISQIEAERAANGGAPTGLLMLMLAPLLLVAFPLVLLYVLRAPAPAENSAAAPVAAVETQSAPQTQQAAPISWQTSLETAQSLARQSGKPIMADFYADWCGPCKMLDSYTWPNAAVQQAAQKFVTLKVDVDAQPAIAQRYNIGPIPCIIWMDGNGNELGRVSGYYGPEDMVALMERYG